MRIGRTVAENAILIAGILCFWVWILGYRGIGYYMGILVVLALLAAVTVARVHRVKRAFEQAEERRGGDGPSSEPRS